MLTAKDIYGVCALPPTPCKEGDDGWDDPNSVDLEESALLVENLIRGGVGMIGFCGTTGECAALLYEEKRALADTAVRVARKRVPIFMGVTALGTKEVIRQMRGMKDIGVDGVFVGLPLWQTPTIENAVRFFADLSEAVPDMPVMIYANALFFKSAFPTAFWEGVARRAPTVVTTKVTYPIQNIIEDVKVAGHQINFMPGERTIYTFYRIFRDRMTALWSTSAGCCGPEVTVALMDAISRDDEKRVDEIWADLKSVPPFVPPGEWESFPYYNAQVEKWRATASGFVKAGPSRAPYYDLPEHWKRQAEAHGRAYAELRKKYVK